MESKFGDEELTSILLGSIPKHNHLYYLMGTIAFDGSNTANASNKAYQNQIFKCRCLIFSEPEVIASPVLGAVLNVHIIVSKDFYLSGKLKPHLDKLSISVAEPAGLTNAVYEACLRYTVLAKLAPSWNQIDRYLVRGRNFLLSPTPLDATKLDIVINEQDMHIVLTPLRMRLPFVCLQDFHLASLQPQTCANLSSLNLRVNVLPSLNQANVLTVSSFIPQNSLFKTYKELKRHWKNSYGYRLPESEEGMIYVTVRFGNWFSESLTYPLLCVRASRPVFLRQRQPQLVLLQLVADLRAKVPYICGFPFGIEASIKYALPKLNVLAQTLIPCNLTQEHPELKRLLVENPEDKEDQNVSQLVSPYTQTQAKRLKH